MSLFPGMGHKQSKLRNSHANTKHSVHFLAGDFTAPEHENPSKCSSPLPSQVEKQELGTP